MNKMTYEELQKENERLNQELFDTKIKYENTKLELDNLKRIFFGKKREYTPEKNEEQIDEQCSLFDDPKEIEENLQE